MNQQTAEPATATRKLKDLMDQVRIFSLAEGGNETAIPYLNIYRYTASNITTPQTEGLYLYMVLDGSIRLHTPTGIMDYMAGQYSISEIDTPVSGHILTFSEKKDFLALSISLTAHDVISVVLDLDGDLPERVINDQIDEDDKTASDKNVITAVGWLVSLTDHPLQLALMKTGLPRVYRRYGDALVLSITLVPGKAYTAAVTQCKTKDVASCAAEGGSLMAIQTNDPKITLVSGGYPLFVNGKIAGGIGVGGGSEEQDCAIAEHVVSVFEELTRSE